MLMNMLVIVLGLLVLGLVDGGFQGGWETVLEGDGSQATFTFLADIGFEEDGKVVVTADEVEKIKQSLRRTLFVKFEEIAKVFGEDVDIPFDVTLALVMSSARKDHVQDVSSDIANLTQGVPITHFCSGGGSKAIIYQWVLRESNTTIRTNRFLCVVDGSNPPPRCPPEMCGSGDCYFCQREVFEDARMNDITLPTKFPASQFELDLYFAGDMSTMEITIFFWWCLTAFIVSMCGCCYFGRKHDLEKKQGLDKEERDKNLDLWILFALHSAMVHFVYAVAVLLYTFGSTNEVEEPHMAPPTMKLWEWILIYLFVTLFWCEFFLLLPCLYYTCTYSLEFLEIWPSMCCKLTRGLRTPPRHFEEQNSIAPSNKPAQNFP